MRWRTSGSQWRLAGSLVTLARQIDAVWPVGGPADGTLGNASHAARRSDHNPNAANVVTAIDVDEVEEDRGQLLVDELVTARDPRIKYIIHESQMWRSYTRTGTIPWEPSPYTGSNPHSSHVHISVVSWPVLYDDRAPWDIDLGESLAAISVEEWQSILNSAGMTDLNGDALVEDGVYGAKTRSALVKMAAGTSVDVGAHNHNTLYALKSHPHTIS